MCNTCSSGLFPIFAAAFKNYCSSLWGGAGRDKFLSFFGLRIAARSTLESVLKRNGLPPLCVRPLVVHPSLLSRLGVVRKLVKSALLEVKSFHAREWIFRVVPGKNVGGQRRSIARVVSRNSNPSTS